MTTTTTILLVLCAVAIFALLAHRKAPDEPPAPTVPPELRPPVQVSFYGDSITRGDDLEVRPVARRTELAAGAFVGVDYSLGGATVQDATAGDARLPWHGPFAQWIAQDPSPVIVLGYAGATALTHAEKLDDYDALLTAMISQAKASGKVVVLSGMTWVGTPVPRIPEEVAVRILQALTDFDARTQAIATRTGCRFLNLRSVAFTGLVDMLDQVHPNQGYADRVSAYVTAELIEVLESTDGRQHG